MATLAYPANLQTAQTGNADSTNVIQRNEETERQMVLRIVSTVGATPTVTVNLLGSIDGSQWFNVPYVSLAAAGGAYTRAALTITTAATQLFALMMGQSWKFLKLNMSANTNVTLTTDIL